MKQKNIGHLPSLNCDALTRKPFVISLIRVKFDCISPNELTNVANCVNETALDFSSNSSMITLDVSKNNKHDVSLFFRIYQNNKK